MSEDVVIEQLDSRGPENEEKTGTIFNQGPEEEDEKEEVEVAQDHELKVLPENEEEGKEEILVTDATKRPSSAESTSTMGKKQLRVRRTKTQALPYEITKGLERQTVEIDKMALLLQSILKQLKPLKIQSEFIKQSQSQLRQIQKQISQIQKNIMTKRHENKNKKKRKKNNKKIKQNN
jgi:hypothetical protein